MSEAEQDRQSPSRLRVWIFALIKCLVITVAVLVGAGVALWNWPAGFYQVSTWIGRIGSKLRLESVEVDGIAVPALIGGYSSTSLDGAPQSDAILFLHGWGTSKEAMLGEMRWFSNSHRVIAPDLPGFGDNPLGPDQPAMTGDDYVLWIDRFRLAAHLDKVDLVGESMGGALAAAYGARFPEHVGRIVLQSAAGVKAPVQNAFMSAIARGENPLRIADEADFDRVLGLCFFHPPPVPAPFKQYLVDRAIRYLPRQQEMVDAIRTFLLEGNAGHLDRIEAPTLVLYGEEDRITDPSMLGVYVRGIRRARGVLLPDAGHVVFYDSPARTRAEMQEFFDSARLESTQP